MKIQSIKELFIETYKDWDQDNAPKLAAVTALFLP